MRKRYNLIFVPILFVLLVLASTPAASAAEAGPFYVGVLGGYVMPQDIKIEDGISEDINMENSWMVGTKFGYIIPTAKWLAPEIEYNYLAQQDIDIAGVDGDFRAHNVMGNLLLRYPEGTFHPYIGFGIGWSWGKIKASGTVVVDDGDDSIGSIDESDNAFAWQLMAGVNFEITPNMSVDIGYKYFQCKYTFGDDPSTDATSRNHMIIMGINFHF